MLRLLDIYHHYNDRYVLVLNVLIMYMVNYEINLLWLYKVSKYQCIYT